MSIWKPIGSALRARPSVSGDAPPGGPDAGQGVDQGAGEITEALPAPGDPSALHGVRRDGERDFAVAASALFWWAGLAFLAIVLAAASAHLFTLLGPSLESAWLRFPDPMPWWCVALTGAIIGGLAFVVRSAWRPDRIDWLLPLGLGLVAVTRMVVIAVVHPAMVGDWANYFDLAQRVADHGPLFSTVPTGMPIVVGLLFRVFGPNVLVGEIANLLFALATGWLVHRLAAATWGRPAGAIALYLYAVSVSQVMMVTVFGTEVIYALAIIAAIAVMLEAVKVRGNIPLAAATGALLAAGQYIRAEAMGLIPAFIILPFLAGLDLRRAALVSSTCVTVFLLLLGPVVAYNRSTYGSWSISTSNFGGWSLLIGTNPTSVGQWNRADQALVPTDSSSREFSDRAMGVAIDRIRAQPLSVVWLSVRKIVPQWAEEDYAASWTLAPAGNRQLDAGPRQVALVSQFVYVGSIAAALAALWMERRRRPLAGLLILLVTGCFALVHTILEAQARYHFFVEPLFLVLAGGWLATRFGPDRAYEEPDRRKRSTAAQSVSVGARSLVSPNRPSLRR
jgi:hypothetical protein